MSPNALKFCDLSNNKESLLQLDTVPKKIYYLKTVSGRMLTYHEKKLISTFRGKIKPENLEVSDQILLQNYKLNKFLLNEGKLEVFSILDDDDFREGRNAKRIPKEKLHLLKEDLAVLSNLNLLPLKSDHPKLPIVARLIGALLTDGNISKYEAVFTVGSFEDAKNINNDIENLGFKSNPVKKYTGKFKSDKRLVEHSVYLTRKGGTSVRFMILLGSPVGRRSIQAVKLPEWIKKGSRLVKREFLGAFLGGDGPSPWFYPRKGRKSSFKITMTKLLMHKSLLHVESQLEFFREIVVLFREFQIEILHIRQTDLRESVDKKVVSIHFKTSKENIYKLCRNIGYRYCKEKHIKAFFVSEYLSYRNQEINRRIKLIERILFLFKNGESHKTIMEKLNVNYVLVRNTILRKKSRHNRKQIMPHSSWTIDQFLRKVYANRSLGHLYVPLEFIKQVLT